MFKKKQCKKCGNKISDKYDFCPYCGNSVSENSNEDWGMLGKNDSISNNFSNPLIGFNGRILNKMLGSAMRMLEKEMKKEMSQRPQTKTNFRLMINGKEIPLDNLEYSRKPIRKKFQKEVSLNNLSQKNLKKFSSLPKQEPSTNIRRLSDKVIYEINIPGIKSIKEISITKLENSIEIKAMAKNKAYYKIIPINLPITSYNLSKEKLILELEAKN